MLGRGERIEGGDMFRTKSNEQCMRGEGGRGGEEGRRESKEGGVPTHKGGGLVFERSTRRVLERIRNL